MTEAGEWAAFCETVERLTGLRLDAYKTSHLQRRLAALAAHHGGWRGLRERIAEDGALYERVVDALTVNVSEFFRQPERFEELRRGALPRLLALRSPLRIWSAGCSVGCEPYSLAILLRELDPGGAHRIIGTDIDEGALMRAREGGGYLPQEVRSVPLPYLRRYFRFEDGTYRVCDEVRRMVTFRRHDLARDPYPAPMDLIMCRNVVIYFTEEQKRHVYRGFAESLRRGGMLFVGGSELLIRPDELGFRLVGTSFYERAA